ncbi:helix-turn-helix domain-containing protein [Streptomyces noursei]|uniref:helix-turn-helix domain-containing protein n=1 Tax=Streptomyces noursei TaxID=1971 RepID=UPI0019641EE1|nr:helix-turn-helix domain-containing protein [Streptomyces noursei]QRX91145.1 hypothetical protein JNO44_10130 [Streptomyces noursei]
MSDTTPDSSHTPHAATAPEPLTGLTGAQAAVYTELLARTEPAAVTKLAHAAGVGHSTAGKALNALEKRDLAARNPGGHDGPCRTPDLWYATTDHKPNGNNGNGQAPTETEPEPTISGTQDTATTDTQTPNGNATAAAEAEPDTHTALGPQSEAPTDTPAPDTDDAAQEEPTADQHAPATNDAVPTSARQTQADQGEPSQPIEPTRAAGHDNAPEPQEPTAPQATPANVSTELSEKRRLAPGALRQMVIDHLRAHPDEAFTATKISRIIEKSSGAIANSLTTLVRLGIAEQASDTPRTFRLAAAAPTNNTE